MISKFSVEMRYVYCCERMLRAGPDSEAKPSSVIGVSIGISEARLSVMFQAHTTCI